MDFVFFLFTTLVLFVVIRGFVTGLWIPPFILPLFGYSKIILKDGEYSFNENFTTYAKLESDKVVTAFRYPWTGVGRVVLYPDGTANYCGSYRWEIA